MDQLPVHRAEDLLGTSPSSTRPARRNHDSPKLLRSELRFRPAIRKTGPGPGSQLFCVHPKPGIPGWWSPHWSDRCPGRSRGLGDAVWRSGRRATARVRADLRRGRATHSGRRCTTRFALVEPAGFSCLVRPAGLEPATPGLEERVKTQ